MMTNKMEQDYDQQLNYKIESYKPRGGGCHPVVGM